MLAVVTGHYHETIERRDLDPWVGYAFTHSDGVNSGGSREQGIAPERLTAAEAILRNVSGPWAEWPSTASSS